MGGFLQGPTPGEEKSDRPSTTSPAAIRRPACVSVIAHQGKCQSGPLTPATAWRTWLQVVLREPHFIVGVPSAAMQHLEGLVCPAAGNTSNGPAVADPEQRIEERCFAALCRRFSRQRLATTRLL